MPAARLIRWLASTALAVLLVVLPSGLVRTADAEESRAEESLAEQCRLAMQAMRCPGALVGVFPDEGPPWTAAVGVADVGTQSPMRADLHMRIGSVSKLFIGTLTLRLVDRGVVSLDDPIGKYVDGVPGGGRMTLRMLGDQTCGLFDPIASGPFQAAILESPKRMWRPAEVLGFALREPVYHPPGEKFRYTNAATVLLGEVIREATGADPTKVLRDEVLGPLGLVATGFCTNASPPEPTPSAYRHGRAGRWLGYGDVFTDVSGYSASWSSWAGDMYSTLGDLGRCAKPLATGELLSEESRAQLHAWRGTGPGAGYGFHISQNRVGIGHSGDVPGFNAEVRYSSEKRAAFVALTNLSNAADGRLPAEELAKLLYASRRSEPRPQRGPAAGQP